MIRRIYSPDELVLSQGCCSDRIRAYAEAYGMGYDFCRFYRSTGGTLLISNSAAFADADISDVDEIGEFIGFIRPYSLECSLCLADRLEITGMRKQKRYLMSRGSDEARGDKASYEHILTELSSRDDIAANGSFKVMSAVVCESFGIEQRDLWYADISHMTRHRVSISLLYKNCAAAVIRFFGSGYALLTDIAVRPDMRGKGMCRELIGIISEVLLNNGIAVKLFSETGNAGMYSSFGFVCENEDRLFLSE